MFLAVPLLVVLRITETKVGTQIDNQRRDGLPVLDLAGCFAVRHAKEEDIALFNILWETVHRFKIPTHIGMGSVDRLTVEFA
jgi:hypothetical protein